MWKIYNVIYQLRNFQIDLVNIRKLPTFCFMKYADG